MHRSADRVVDSLFVFVHMFTLLCVHPHCQYWCQEGYLGHLSLSVSTDLSSACSCVMTFILHMIPVTDLSFPYPNSGSYFVKFPINSWTQLSLWPWFGRLFCLPAHWWPRFALWHLYCLCSTLLPSAYPRLHKESSAVIHVYTPTCWQGSLVDSKLVAQSILSFNFFWFPSWFLDLLDQHLQSVVLQATSTGTYVPPVPWCHRLHFQGCLSRR